MWIYSCLFLWYITPVSCNWVQYENSCYWISEANKNFNEAELVCQAMDGDLVTIETVPEFDFINSELKYHSTTHNYWVGIIPKDYKWKDNSEPNQMFWFDNEPNYSGDCVRLKIDVQTTNGKFYLADHGCSKSYRYICEKKLKDIFNTDSEKQTFLEQYDCLFRNFTVGSFLQCATSCYEDWQCSTFGIQKITNRCYHYQRSQSCSTTQNLDVYYKKRICEHI